MSNSVEFQSMKATLVRLAYGMDVGLDDTLEKRVHAVVTKYVMKSEGRQLSQFLIQPILTAIADYPERPAPFNVLQCLLAEFQRWKTSEPVLRAAATTLKTLVILQERLPSLCNKIYPALQACISLLDGRLKPPAVDGVASACFLALESDNWTHKVGAMEVLATLVRCARSTTAHTTDIKKNRTLLTDFLDLAAITAQRQAHFDPSERVKEAAFTLLSTIECPVEIDAENNEKEKSGSAESVEPLVVNSRAESRSSNRRIDDDVIPQQQESPLPLALTPLPEFSKELSEDELNNWKKETTIAAGTAGTAASPSTGSVPDTMQHSHDAFSMLGSDIQSINSAIEMDIENFLRGSILPLGGAAGGRGILEQQKEEEEEEEDVYSEGWNDFLRTSVSKEVNEEESIATDDALINLVVAQALEEHFKNHSDASFTLKTEQIEQILRTCLDIHSEHAYERHLQRAEALLVRTSQHLQGKFGGDAELQRQVQQLESDVHRAVAEDQAQFMESVVPEIADILANPQLLERLLVN